MLQETNSNFIVSIIDQGPGIPEALHSRVFERFYRVVGSKQSGTGLGLNIVSQVVNLHRGKLSLASASNGKGLNVTLVFRKPDPVHTDLLDLDAT